MYVLIDIEWVKQDTGEQVAQFAAVRVTADCRSMEEFQCLVCPAAGGEINWKHMAYSGYSPDAFRAGVTEIDCVRGFLGFLRADDIICCWHGDTKHLLERKIKACTDVPVQNKIVCLNDKVCLLAASKGMASFGLYTLAAQAGVDTTGIEHQSVNDVYVLRALLSALGCNLKRMLGKAQGAKKKFGNKRERNADIIARVNYNYIFTSNSGIFHRTGCKLMLNANDIKGSVYYRTAAKKRRPCKVCHPKPDEAEDLGKIVSPAGLASQERTINSDEINLNLTETVNSIKLVILEKNINLEELISPGKNTKPEKNMSPAKQAKNRHKLPPPEKKVVLAKMLGEHWMEIATTKIVGYCHNAIHPGNLTGKIMEQHDCIRKNCRFFEKYTDSSFWLEQESKKRKKEAKKAAKQRQKKAVQELEDELEKLKQLLQLCADAAEHEMLIVRIEKEQPNRYKVFYVSEFPFADSNRFLDFFQIVKYFLPRANIQLRHIRDVEGHFVTVEEYEAIHRRKK